MLTSVFFLINAVSCTILNQQYVGLGNVSLNREESPYYIITDCTVYDNLFIQDGVDIIFNSSATLQIIKSVNGCNNILNGITISGINNNMNPSINIRTDLGAKAIFCNTRFQSMSTAINIGCSSIYNNNDQCGSQTGSVQFHNVYFQDIKEAITFSDGTGIKSETYTNIKIDNSIFNKVNNIITTYNSSHSQSHININTEFKNCSFNNFDNILINYTQQITFTDSNIIGNGMGTCLCGGNGVLTNVTITNCDIGIQMLSTMTTGFDIYYSYIKDNNIGILSGSYSNIKYTNFINNTINIKHTSINDRMYDNNFWGTTDEKEIVNKIMDVCDDEYHYNSTTGYGLIIWWPYLSSMVMDINDSLIESVLSTDITEHSLNYCKKHILSSVYSGQHNRTWLVEDSPLYVVSDIIICDDLYINSGSTLIFTGDYLMFIAEGINTCPDSGYMTNFIGQNYGIPNDKTYRGSMMIDVAGGVDANVCYVVFTGMKAAIILTSGGNGDSMVAISHCTFSNLKSGMSSYSGHTIPDIANAICLNNITTTTSEPTQTTAVASSTLVIDTTELTEMETSSVIVINPTETKNDDGGDTDIDTDDHCTGVDDDTLDFLIIKGECNSCGIPLNEGIITSCLKKSYYNYYLKNYDISWDLNDMICDSLFVINIDDDDYLRREHKIQRNGHSTVCRDKYEIKFKLDVIFDSDLIAQNQFDKISINTDDNILQGQIEDDVASFMVFCEPQFEAIDCDITRIISNIPLNTSKANYICTLNVLSLIFIVFAWLYR